MLAVARIGAVVVPFSTFATTLRDDDQLAHADIEILLATASYRNHDYRERLAAVDRRPSPCCAMSSSTPNGTTWPTVGCSRRWRTTSTDPTPWPSCTPRVPPPRPRELCTPTRRCSNTRGFSTTSVASPPTTGCSATRRSSGSAVSRSPAREPARRRHPDLLQRRRPGRDARPAGSREADHDKRFRRGHRPPRPRSAAFARRDLSSMRRGNLYPIMAPEVRPADPELRHTMLGMTEAGSVITDQRRRVRPTRASARIVRQARTRVRDQGRRQRRAVHPRAVRHAALLQAQPRGVLRRRRLVPHRRSGARRRGRFRLLRRPPFSDDQDRGRQRRTRRGRARHRQGNRADRVRDRHPRRASAARR